MMQVSTLTSWTAMASVSWSSTLGWGGAVSRGRGQGVASGSTLQQKGAQGQEKASQGRWLNGLGALGAWLPCLGTRPSAPCPSCGPSSWPLGPL